MKTCTVCDLKKELSDFYKSKYSKDGHFHMCKSCDKIRQYEYLRRKNKERGAKSKIPTLLARELYIKGFKKCPRCKEIKPLVAFYTSAKSNRGYASHCIVCSSLLGKERPKSERQIRYKKSKRRIRNNILFSKFGITIDEYELIEAKQKGLCAICSQPESQNKGLAVDHCHETNKVRGLLCSFCNPGLGLFKDNIELLKKAICYLEKKEGGY